MPLTTKQLEDIERLASVKFRQHTCDVCGEPYYSVSDKSKHCSPACSANAYRVRVQEKVKTEPTKKADADPETDVVKEVSPEFVAEPNLDLQLKSKILDSKLKHLK